MRYNQIHKKRRTQIVHLHKEEGHTYKSITAEYGVSKAAISAWCKQSREECNAILRWH